MSELAYYHIAKWEVDEKRRAKLVPCDGFQELIRRGQSTDVERLLAQQEVRSFAVADRAVVAVGVAGPDVLFIGFRGTCELFDWGVNLRAELVAVDSRWRIEPPGLAVRTEGRVHRGFAKEALEITGLARPRHEGDGMEALTALRPEAGAGAAATGPVRRNAPGLTLSVPFPSPAVASVRVECVLPAEVTGGDFGAAILDLAGRNVRTLDRRMIAAGTATVTWDLRDSAGRRVSPGVYFLRVRAAGSSRTARLVVAAGR